MKSIWKPFAIYAFLDILCTGMGMGVPIMNIQLGFLVGWYLARRALREEDFSPSMLRTLLLRSLITVLLTFAMMAVIWGPWCKVLWDSNYDYTQTGVPLILYGAKSSFIGWLVLMVFISPFLQLLTTLSAAVVTLAVSLGYQSHPLHQ